jgi:peptide/nickel transport system ATP-binding protein
VTVAIAIDQLDASTAHEDTFVHEQSKDSRGKLLLSVSDLTIVSAALQRPLVENVSFEVRAGETAGIVGESGSGKSLTCLSLLSLLPRGLRVASGSIRFEGAELAGLSERSLQKVRGSQVGFVFQDPVTTLNPALSVGDQIREGIRAHAKVSRAEAHARSISWLDRVGIPDAKKRFNARPVEFSGGMRQRVMIAVALSSEPKLLIADEPTTALDVTIQAQVLDLIRDLQRETGVALILVTHDLGVARSMCETVNVMYSGQLVERGPAQAVLTDARHPYTQGLLRSVPSLDPGATIPVGIAGLPPRGGANLAGCRFYDRCEHHEERCRPDPIALRNVGRGRETRCVLNFGGREEAP